VFLTRDSAQARAGMRFDGGMRVEPFLQARRSLVVGVAAVLPLVACAVLSLFRDSVANTNAALGLVLLVVAAASTGIRAAGLVAALSSAAWFDFFLTEPYNHFAIADQADIETAALLTLVGLAVTEIALWGRRQQASASRQQGYLEGVLSTAATVGAGRTSTSSLIDHVRAQIVDVLEIDDCRFDHDTGPVLATLNHDGTVTYNGQPWAVDRHGLPTDTEIALPVKSGGVVHGRFLLTAATRVVRPSLEQLRVAGGLASQVGAALAVSNLDGRLPRGSA
jgi:K+-sensing histidine kinase KdpD